MAGMGFDLYWNRISIVAAILELRTRKTYVDRGEKTEEDEWSIFDDDEDGSDSADKED